MTRSVGVLSRVSRLFVCAGCACVVIGAATPALAGATAGPGGLGIGVSGVGIGGPGIVAERTQAGYVELTITRSQGGLGQAGALMMLRRRQAALRSCYERGLRLNPSLQGRLVLRLAVDPAGTVVTSEVVTSFLQPSDVQPCIARVLRIVRFVPFGGTEPATLMLQIVLTQVARRPVLPPGRPGRNGDPRPGS
ncbi:MAG: AgmX/PglI C-terminal domain-containing protein [Deltaproteobacteria bacterium]